MRQLYGKNSYERLKKLHWEKASEPKGRFCYFVSFTETSAKRFNSQLSVMELKGRRRLESQQGVLCDVQFFTVDSADQVLTNLRKAVGTIITDADALGTREVTVFLDLAPETLELVPLDSLLSTCAETFELSCYTARAPENDADLVVNLILPSTVVNSSQEGSIESALDEGIHRGQSLNYARWLGDLPANALYPQTFAAMIEERLSQVGQVTTLNERELEAQGFGGIIAVGQGSKNRPRLVIFEAGPEKPEKTIVIIGKGMTFDTGGYSIKGKQHHNEMKYDMCGAANVVSALEILVPHLPQIRFVGIMPLAENMVSADAQRPGDVYQAHNGKWIEVYNTDAEGRLILGDALSFATQFNPDAIIDIATLTGGTTQIAGNMAGVMCTNDEDLLPTLKKACREAGEKFVHLEILDEAIEDLKSDVADLTNMHNRWSTGAATMYAAAFLKQFVPADTLWIHLDIANVAWSGRTSPYLRNRGATSYGARSMVNIVKAICG
ncbi:MAG: hypothetical protein RI932_1903 [Pseudomonadota bacterium]|jgi:leucyl aminopeptidase